MFSQTLSGNNSSVKLVLMLIFLGVIGCVYSARQLVPVELQDNVVIPWIAELAGVDELDKDRPDSSIKKRVTNIGEKMPLKEAKAGQLERVAEAIKKAITPEKNV